MSKTFFQKLSELKATKKESPKKKETTSENKSKDLLL